MAKRRGPDSGCTVTEALEFNTVFVDTSLDTHLAVLVSSSDTVSDFKKKMAVEHKHLFPTIGEIQVHAIKVERRSNFYHLPDIMLLWSVFHEKVRRKWFLSADVSGAHACHSIKNSSELNTSNEVKMGVPNDDSNCRGLLPDASRIQALPMLLADGATEKTIDPEMIGGIRLEKSVEKSTELGTDSRPRKKRKMEDECHNHSSGDACTLFEASGKNATKTEIVRCANLMADSIKESPGDGILPEQNRKSFSGATDKVSVVRNDHFEETSTRSTEKKSNVRNTMTSQNLLASDETKKDNLLEGKMGDELAQDALTIHTVGVSVNVLDHVARARDVGEVNIDGSKRMKTKRNRMKMKNILTTAGKLEDTTDMEQTGKVESMKTCSETLKSDLKEGEKGSYLDKNLAVVDNKSSDHLDVDNKSSDHLDPVSMLKETSFSWDADALMKPEPSSGYEKKKKNKTCQKKSVDTNLENSGIDQMDNCISSSSALLLPLTDHIPEDIDKGEGNTHHDEKDVQVLLDSSTLDARKKVQGVNEDEAAGSMMLTQTEQASEDGVFVKKKADKSTQSSSGNCNADIHSVETENPVMEFNKVVNVSKNTGNKNKKASKKRKKQKLTAAEDQVNLPGEDQQVGVAALANVGTSISVVNTLDTNLENSGIDQTDNCISSSSALLLPLTDHFPESIDKGEGNTHHDEKDVQVLLDSSTLDAWKKVQGVNGDEAAGSMMLTQTEQASEDGVFVKKKADKSTQSSSGNCNADIHSVETENPVMEFNKVVSVSKNTGNKDKKASKKRKKQKLTAAEDQVNLPGEDQQVGVAALANVGTSISVVNSEQEGRQVESSQVLYSKTEEKSKIIHGIAENTDDLKTSGKGGEGINFKQYFAPDQDQHKENSSCRRKKAIKSKMETSKRIEDNDLPFASNLAELQHSSKSLVNKKAENESHTRNSGSKGGSAKNSDRDEVISNSFRRSSGASEEQVKDSSPRLETTLQKPNESLAASSRLNRKNRTLDKSISDRSEVLPRKQGNKILQLDLKVTNMAPMKTPQKSVFAKSGPIFQENSDESSGDENGTMHKPGESLAASSFLNKKFRTSDKSSSVRSELPRNQGSRRLQSGLKVTNMMPVKTPQKKSLFTKSGSIFQDNGGESSGAENGAMHSVGDTVVPSDSSSMSGDSVGGSDMSQDSTRNGSNYAEGRPTGRRNMSKLELSGSKELTMDAILRSSKRFKKAKLVASQIESEAIEFVPDSQPS